MCQLQFPACGFPKPLHYKGAIKPVLMKAAQLQDVPVSRVQSKMVYYDLELNYHQ